MKLHHCSGYIGNIEHLPIGKETIQRAIKVGFDVIEFAESSLKSINKGICQDDNGYRGIARVVECFVDAVMPFLKKYEAGNIEVSRFQARDTSEEKVVYLSQMYQGLILVETDEDGNNSIRTVSTDNIWRYLTEPRQIIEATLSALIAYAEKHKDIKDEWIQTLERIKTVSRTLPGE